MELVITQPGQFSVEWLNSVLRGKGILEQAEVAAVDVSEWPVLKLSYAVEPKGKPGFPARLFLKIIKEGASTSPDINNKRQALGSTGQNEVDFYRLAVSRQDLPMILPCYDVASSPDDRTAHLLLQDYSLTHVEPAWTVPITRHREEITRCSAQFHSKWWQYAQLSQVKRIDLNINLNCQDEAGYKEYVRVQQEAFPYFVDFLGDNLTPSMRKMYERTLTALPNFWPKYLKPRLETLENITLLHGDSHWGQFVCPLSLYQR